jgi:hypothetical protein
VEAVDELPHESVAVQVLVTEYEPAHEPLVVTSAEVNDRTTSICSRCCNTGADLMLMKSPVKQQSLEPFILYVNCEAVDELPHESVAVQVLVTEYEPAHEPLVVTSAEVNVKAEPQASVAVATANTG